MAAPFPLSSGGNTPALFVNISGTTRGNIYLETEAPTFTFNKAFTGTYTVRNYYGATVATGALVAATGVTPTAPVGGWPRGWYRLYLNDGTTRTDFGTSLGVTNFCVVKNDTRFVRPTRTGGNYVVGGAGEAHDFALKGFLGLGTSRMSIVNAASPNTGTLDQLPSVVEALGISNTYWTTGANHRGPDPTRPRHAYVNFPNDCVDHLFHGALIIAYRSGAVAANGNVTIVIAAGSVSGRKYTITQGTTIEQFDNVTNTASAAFIALSASNLIRCYRSNDADYAATVATHAGLTLTNACYLGVKLVVQTCYPLGVEWYEQFNEPDLRKNPSRYAHDARMFQDAVRAGNGSAKTMGPSPVDINDDGIDPTDLTLQPSGGAGPLYRYLMGYQNWPVDARTASDPVAYAASTLSIDGPPTAAKPYLDGIMIHVYNFMTTDLNSGYTQLDNFVSILTKAGVANLPRFQGELGVLTPVFGVYHPRRAHWQMLHHFMLERYGMPMERNTLWYDISHGFWAFPGWWENADQSVNPHALFLRVMAEEIYGRPYEGALDFGPVGRQLYMGNVYAGTDGTRRVGLIAASHLDDKPVVLQLAGTLPETINWRSPSGVDNVATVDGSGRVSVPVNGEPTWVALPSGCTATVHSFLGLRKENLTNLAGRNAFFGGFGSSPVAERRPVDSKWQKRYDALDVEVAKATSPANYRLYLNARRRVSTVLTYAGVPWQAQATLTDFDVQTGMLAPNLFPNPSFETTTDYANLYNGSTASLSTPTVIPHGSKVLQVDPGGPGATGADLLATMLYPITVVVGQRVSLRVMMKLSDDSPSSSLMVGVGMFLYNNGSGVGAPTGYPDAIIYPILTKTWQTVVLEGGIVNIPTANQLGVQVHTANSTGKIWANSDKIELDRVQITDTATAPAYDDPYEWTTRGTYTRVPSSFLHGSNDNNTGTQRETFWDEAWVVPVQFPAVEADAVRLVVRDTSNGGEPDAAAVTTGGQGNATKQVCLTEIVVLDDPPSAYAATV